jgi:Fe-S oxidoreductase
MPFFDIRDPRFFDEEDAEKELRRVFQICHGCRLCFSFCPSFPELFDRVDEHVERGEGEAEVLTRGEIGRVVDLCYQCKLCYVKCPYTPPHEWDVDFPRVVLRAKAARARTHGVTLQDRVLGDPDRLGKMAAVAPSLVNWANENALVRGLMEKTLGVHRERNLPRFHAPYARWHEQNAQPTPGIAAGSVAAGADCSDTVALYGTCAVNYNEPDVGAATTQVLEKNGKRVAHVYPGCCGMPALDGGEVERAARQAEENVRALAPIARAGLPILVPQPTCGYVVKNDWPALLGSDDAKVVAAAAVDVCEYLLKLHKQGRLDTGFTVAQGKIAYHAPCHLRAQNIGLPARELLRLIPGTEVETVEKCSAFDGTWGMKKEFFPLSLKYAGKLTRAIAEAEPARVASDCRLAGLNVTKAIGRTPSHPVQLLRDAYGLAPTYPYDDPPRPVASAAGDEEEQR